MQNPAMHGRMVQRGTVLGYHFLRVAQAQIVSQVTIISATELCDHGFHCSADKTALSPQTAAFLFMA